MEGIELVGNRLRVSIDLDLESQTAFKEGCAKLAAVEEDPLYLDLSEAGFIGSAFFGELFVLNHEVQDSGRTLVIRTSRQLLSIMELLGLPELVPIEVVEHDANDAAE